MRQLTATAKQPKIWVYDEAEIQEWLGIMFRLRTEVSAQELARQNIEPRSSKSIKKSRLSGASAPTNSFEGAAAAIVLS
jgi:hypothetical protein